LEELVKSSLFYKITAVVLVLFAAGHTFGFRQTDPSWRVDSLVASMKAIHFNVQGFDRTYWNFFLAFGLFLTVFLLFSVVLSWQLGSMKPDSLSQIPLIRWSFALCYVAIAVLSWCYVFVIPGVMATLVAVGLLLAAWLPARPTGGS
jgi:hypothetical protein